MVTAAFQAFQVNWVKTPYQEQSEHDGVFEKERGRGIDMTGL